MTSRQQVIAVAAMLAIVGAVDFGKRVHVPRQPAMRELDAGKHGLPAPPMPLAMARQRLQSWLPAPALDSKDAAADALTRPGTAATSVPDRAEIGGWQFVLRGVFDAGPPFAVLDVTSTSGGAVEQHRLSAGEAINGVRVEEIAGRRVTLSDGESVIQLALFVDPGTELASADEQDE